MARTAAAGEFVELFQHPGAVRPDEVFDRGERHAARRADGETAFVDAHRQPAAVAPQRERDDAARQEHMVLRSRRSARQGRQTEQVELLGECSHQAGANRSVLAGVA